MSYAQPTLGPRTSISRSTIASAYFALDLNQNDKH
jgi:hypothetical protein